jgi:two-component system, OmpR family, sensor histidine kinase BaeS
LKFGIGPRLFLAVLLSFTALGVAGIVTVRWSLFADGSAPSTVIEPGSLELIHALETSYRKHDSWAFVPGDAQDRHKWLHDLSTRMLKANGRGSAMETSGTFSDRIALVDASGHTLSGVVPGPLLRALGSIDTRWLPLTADDQIVGYLAVAGASSADDKLAVAFLLQKRGELGVIAGIGLLLSIALAMLLAAHFRRPIGKLVDAARMLEGGRFDTRMDDSRTDELGELASTFNHLAGRLERGELGRRQWVADTSHELRTPLAVLRAQIESLEDGIRAPTPENLGLIRKHVETMTRRVDDLYELARADRAEMKYEKRRVDFWPIVEAVAAGFRDRATAAGLSVVAATDAFTSTVICDADRMQQVLVNLMENAVRYTDSGGQIHVRGRSEGGALLITIDDSLPGVSEPSLDRLGERFFRTDIARAGKHGGAGLGLALARQIVEAHGGQLAFAASDLGGLQATVSLPLAPVE